MGGGGGSILYHCVRIELCCHWATLLHLRILVYFYMLYLTVEYDDVGLNILTFLPQLILILALTYRKPDIPPLLFHMEKSRVLDPDPFIGFSFSGLLDPDPYS